MYNYSSKFFSGGFKEVFFQACDRQRDVIRKRLFGERKVTSYRVPEEGYSIDLLFGKRAKDNEQIFQAFCSRQEQNKINNFSIKNSDAQNEACATRIETILLKNKELLDKEIFQAFIMAMDCDYYYEKEKSYI